MNTQSNDVVKTADLTSNEQHKAVKPIIVSRRRLLRAGVAGIPVMLTMAGVAPGDDSIKTNWSAASGLNYDGLGIRARFNKTDFVSDDNLVHSNANGFVYNTDSSKGYGGLTITTSALSGTSSDKIDMPATTSVTGAPTVSLQLTVKDLSSTSGSDNTLTFDLFKHKMGDEYTDFLFNNQAKTIEQYFTSLEKTDLEKFVDYKFTVSGTLTDTSESVTALSCTSASITSTWSQASGVKNADSSTSVTYYKRASGSNALEITLNLKVSATVTGKYTDTSSTVHNMEYKLNEGFTVKLTYTFPDT